MDHPRTDHSDRSSEPQHANVRSSAWERALSGPPINPNSELIYHDRKTMRSRHS